MDDRTLECKVGFMNREEQCARRFAEVMQSTRTLVAGLPVSLLRCCVGFDGRLTVG
jgi:hypothetical protein